MYTIALHPKYVLSVPQHHRFPMEKYELLPLQLLHRGVVHSSQFFQPDTAAIAPILAVHDALYIYNFLHYRLSDSEVRRIGFKHNKALVERELLLVEGTIRGAENALRDGIAFNIAGGTHHACRGHGEGFCMINDQGVAARYLLDHYHHIRKVLIIDLDVHQGNGTADLFKHSSDVFTFSMHCEKNYPFRKTTSHLDIGLEVGTGDDTYLRQLEATLHQLVKEVAPDFIFYQAGVDILHTDKMGKLNCTIKGCASRDRLVFDIARSHGIPLQCSMGGGYSANISDILEAHTNTYIQANEVYL